MINFESHKIIKSFIDLNINYEKSIDCAKYMLNELSKYENIILSDIDKVLFEKVNFKIEKNKHSNLLKEIYKYSFKSKGVKLDNYYQLKYDVYYNEINNQNDIIKLCDSCIMLKKNDIIYIQEIKENNFKITSTNTGAILTIELNKLKCKIK